MNIYDCIMNEKFCDVQLLIVAFQKLYLDGPPFLGFIIWKAKLEWPILSF